MSIGMGLSIGNASGGRRYEPKRQFRWVLETAPPADIGIGEVIKLVAKTGTRPSQTFEKTTIHRLNHSFHMRGKGEWEDMEFTFNDGGDSGTNIAKALYTWSQAIYDPSTDIMLPESAVKADESNLKLVNGAGETIESWLLLGLAPLSTNYGQVDYASSDVMEVSCTFTVDKCVLVEAV